MEQPAVAHERSSRRLAQGPGAWRLLAFGLAVFLILCGLGVPAEEYDGMHRRLVADSLWKGAGLGSTWFDFGSILTLYLFYFPASLLKETLHLGLSLSDLAILLHGAGFAAATSVLMLAAVSAAEEGPKLARSPGWLPLLALAFLANPVLFTAERHLIETPLAFYLLALDQVLARDPGRSERWAWRWALVPLAGAAVLTRGASAVFVLPLLALAAWRRAWAQAAALAIGLAIGAAGSCAWNAHRYGDWLAYSYGRQGFDANTLHGLYAFLFSPGLGIFTFYPLSILGVMALYRRCREGEALAGALAVSLLAFLMLFASWCVYDGGLSYGPRFMLPILPILGVLGLARLGAVRSVRVRAVLVLAFALWGSCVNFNAILMPSFFFHRQWAQSAPIWEMDAEEKQINLNFAERLQIFDPGHSHYLGGIGTFLRRADVWELPFLKFRRRRVRTVFDLYPYRPVRRFSLISRGSKATPWVVSEIETSETEGGARIAFRLTGDRSFARLENAVDGIPSTFAASPVISSGTRLTIELDTPRDAPFRVEMSHADEHEAFPHSYVVQEEPGGYFGGNLNDPSYIRFRKSFRVSNRVAGPALPAVPLLAGVFLLGALVWARPRGAGGTAHD